VYVRRVARLSRDLRSGARVQPHKTTQTTPMQNRGLGVSAVMPAESIAQLLDREDIMNDRKARERGYLRPGAADRCVVAAR
jgi:hypothetical protein